MAHLLVRRKLLLSSHTAPSMSDALVHWTGQAEVLRPPEKMIENRVVFAGRNAELSLYDTYCPARKVSLSSPHVLYCGMITGSKVMHGVTEQPRSFRPHESFILAPDQCVYIDFPEAQQNRPTTCMTIEINSQQVQQVCDKLNTRAPRDPELQPWSYTPRALHVPHGQETQGLLERLTRLFAEDHSDRNALIDLALDELIVRMLRTQGRELLLTDSQPGKSPRHGLAAVLQWLQNNVAETFDGQRLAKEASMSKARLYRQFKSQLGCTPREYQQHLRLERARALLADESASITRICFELGYRSLSHFTHCFKVATGMPPGQFRREHAQKKSISPEYGDNPEAVPDGSRRWDSPY